MRTDHQLKTGCRAAVAQARRITEQITPLETDCGALCGARCCGGDENTGMELFFGESSPELTVKTGSDGVLVAVCNGTCSRNMRPLSCRIFPLYPVVSMGRRGIRVRAVIDPRAGGLCPLLNADNAQPTARFRHAVRRAGQRLARCRTLRREMERTGQLLSEIVLLNSRLTKEQ